MTVESNNAYLLQNPAEFRVYRGSEKPRSCHYQTKKVFLYSHDTFGLGHLRRNLAIAHRLLNHPKNFSVYLLTGSPVIKNWKLPYGLHVQPLPPVVKVGAERYRPRGHGHCFGLVKGYREALMLKLVMLHRPDFFIVDHAPAGMNGELLGTLALIRREMPRTRVMLGLRDILDCPDIVQATWREQDVHALLDQAYDDVLVYGSRLLFDVVEGYAMADSVASKVRYCGHVVAAADPVSAGGASPIDQAPCWDLARAAGRRVVLVTAGGGGDGFALMKAYLHALDLMPGEPVYSVVVTGPLMSQEERTALQAIAARYDTVELVEYTTDLVPSLRAAHLVIAMAGYNTSAEIIAERKRAILVPRAAPRAEQRLRAGLLARLGVARTLQEGPRLAHELAELIPVAIAEPGPAEALWASLDLNGAERVADYLGALADAGGERAPEADRLEMTA